MSHLCSGSLSEAERLDCMQKPLLYPIAYCDLVFLRAYGGGSSFTFRDRLLTMSASQTLMPSNVSSAYRRARPPALHRGQDLA